MMRAGLGMTRLLQAAVLPLVTLAVAAEAHAIPLPDVGTCSSSGSNSCLKITNSGGGTGMRGEGLVGLFGQALTSSGVSYGVIGNAPGQGAGLYGSSNGAGYGVLGTTNNISAAGVYGSNGAGNGVFGASSSNAASGVYGNNGSNGGFGVAGRVVGSGNGAAVFGDSGFSGTAWAGRFDGRVTASQYLSNSDARLKTNIQDSRYGVETLSKLRPVTYKWKDPKHDQTPQVGLIAQEVQKVMPELVSADSETKMLSVNYQGLVPVLVKAAQDQQAMIGAQQKVIKAQEDRIAALERANGRPLEASTVLPGLGLLSVVGFAAWRRRRSA